MLDFYPRLIPWAEARIAEEVAGGYPALKGIPGNVAEATIKVFDELGPTLALRYMTERLRSFASLNREGAELQGQDEFLAEVSLRLVEASSQLWEIPRKGFDRRTFIKHLPLALEDCGHQAIERAGNVVGARSLSGDIEVETEVFLGKRLAYFHRVRKAGELACVQMSLACWLGVDAATTYEPSAEHSAEEVLGHMAKYWRIFLSAVPALAGDSGSLRA
ncbi:MAG: hypothetical protein R2862_13275 [Thermoanaerobaculia bacterium]